MIKVFIYLWWNLDIQKNTYKWSFSDCLLNTKKIINVKTREKIEKLVQEYDKLIENDNINQEIYEKLFFAKLFLSYAKNKKGEVALEILLDSELLNNLVIPSYIKEGIKWLVK